jgi:hypothetical protein
MTPLKNYGIHSTLVTSNLQKEQGKGNPGWKVGYDFFAHKMCPSLCPAWFTGYIRLHQVLTRNWRRSRHEWPWTIRNYHNNCGWVCFWAVSEVSTRYVYNSLRCLTLCGAWVKQMFESVIIEKLYQVMNSKKADTFQQFQICMFKFICNVEGSNMQS